jgi:hypothetical protein
VKGESAFVVSLIALLCCSQSDGGARPWHGEQPKLWISVALPTDAGIATVAALSAPPVRFDALVQPDPNHILEIAAPTSGTIVQIRADSTVYRGDTLALVERKSDGSVDRAWVVATHDGTWRSSRRAGQFAWEGELLGLLEQRGYWLAVGTVSDLEAQLIHSSDPALIERRGVGLSLAGRVEAVGRPGNRYVYLVEVAVEFRVPRDSAPDRWRDVTVLVTPTDPRDSVAVVPATAVVQLAPGSAVFVPIGSDRFDLVWVSTGPPVNDREISITSGIRPGMKVVTNVAAVPLLAHSRGA